MRLSQVETAQIMHTLSTRRHSDEALPVVQHQDSADLDWEKGMKLFQLWNDRADAVDEPEQQLRKAIAAKRLTLSSARRVLAHTRNKVRKFVERDPQKLRLLNIEPGVQSRSFEAVLQRLSDLHQGLETHPQLRHRLLPDYSDVHLDLRIVWKLHQTIRELEAARNRVTAALTAYKQAKTRAMHRETSFRYWFDKATATLRKVIRTHFPDQAKALFQWFSLDLHQRRQRLRDNRYRSKKRNNSAAPEPQTGPAVTAAATPGQPAEEAHTMEAHGAHQCPTCQGSGLVMPFKPNNEPQPNRECLTDGTQTETERVKPPPSMTITEIETPEPNEPEPGRPASPSQLARALMNSNLWIRRHFENPISSPKLLARTYELLWANPDATYAQLKPMAGLIPGGFARRLSWLTNVPGFYAPIIRVDSDAESIHLNRRFLLEAYDLPLTFLGEPGGATRLPKEVT